VLALGGVEIADGLDHAAAIARQGGWPGGGSWSCGAVAIGAVAVAVVLVAAEAAGSCGSDGHDEECRNCKKCKKRND
jgi:hypothetical protein